MFRKIKEGCSIFRIANLFPLQYIRYHRGIGKLINLINPSKDRDFKTEVHYIYGGPGVGKSKKAREEALVASEDIYYKRHGERWDGYHQQPNVINDDFYGWIKYDELLKVCDRYHYRVPIKGGCELFNSKKV